MKTIVFRIVGGLVLLAAIAGIAFFAFNAGVARGEGVNIQAPANQNGVQAYPYYGMPFYWRHFPFFGFGFLGIFALLIPVFLVFSAVRMMIWGPRFGRRWMHGSHWGRWNNADPNHEEIPPMFAEMHRRMHEADKEKQEKPADPGSQKQA
jgi:hypothetical protein